MASLDDIVLQPLSASREKATSTLFFMILFIPNIVKGEVKKTQAFDQFLHNSVKPFCHIKATYYVGRV
ncbi:hypothetical protein [Pantoea ananatis]|nr:hypothetical protein [Pantoea ananatis]